MKTLDKYIDTYRKQLKEGNIQKAYKGLIEYMMALKTHLTNKYSEDYVAGHFYQGYMNVTYFSFTPESLKGKKLKIVIVFDYEKFRFEVCLAAQNKAIQSKYWKLLKDMNWDKHHLPTSPQDVVTYEVLAENPDFSRLDVLTEQIEKGTMIFIKNVTDTLK